MLQVELGVLKEVVLKIFYILLIVMPKELLGVRADLGTVPGLNHLLDLLPLFTVSSEGFNEVIVLLVRPSALL